MKVYDIVSENRVEEGIFTDQAAKAARKAAIEKISARWSAEIIEYTAEHGVAPTLADLQRVVPAESIVQKELAKNPELQKEAFKQAEKQVESEGRKAIVKGAGNQIVNATKWGRRVIIAYSVWELKTIYDDYSWQMEQADQKLAKKEISETQWHAYRQQMMTVMLGKMATAIGILVSGWIIGAGVAVTVVKVPHTVMSKVIGLFTGKLIEMGPFAKWLIELIKLAPAAATYGFIQKIANSPEAQKWFVDWLTMGTTGQGIHTNFAGMDINVPGLDNVIGGNAVKFVELAKEMLRAINVEVDKDKPQYKNPNKNGDAPAQSGQQTAPAIDWNQGATQASPPVHSQEVDGITFNGWK